MINNTNYTEKSYKQIFSESIEYAQELGILSDDDEFITHINNLDDIENFKVLDLSVHSNLDSKLYEDMSRIYDSFDVDKATGVDLDRLGAFFNVRRPQALSSVAGLTFTINNTVSQDIVIPQGTIVSTDDGEEFVTVETVSIVAGNSTVDVTAKSVATGYQSRVGKNTLVNLITKVDAHNAKITVNNNSNTTIGRNEATDSEYRQLIKDWHNLLTRGTESAYNFYFRNYESIDGYRLIPHWDGPGTLKIVIDAPDEALTSIIKEIESDLKSDVHMYADDDVVIVPAERVLINDIVATVNVDIDNITEYTLPEKEDITLRIKNAIETFVDGGYRVDGSFYPGLGIGEDFIPYKCAVFLDSEIPELKNCTFKDSNNVVIEDYEKAKCGDIIINME